jgi:hypothetical protein
MRKSIALIAATATMLALAVPAFAAHDANPSERVASYTYQVGGVPHPGTDQNEDVSGTIRIRALPNQKAQVKARLSGLTPNQPHAQHLHGALTGGNDCPTSVLAGTAIENGMLVPGDDFIATLDAASAYGGIQVSLTTSGDTSPASALAVSRFPVADSNGNLSYDRTFEVSDDVYAALGVLHYVAHGIDIDGSGGYDGPESPLTAAIDAFDLPFEATIPAGCGGPGN